MKSIILYIYIQHYKLKPFDKDNHFLEDYSEGDEQIKSIKENRSFNNFYIHNFKMITILGINIK